MDSRLLQAEALGIKLEIVNGLPMWEAQPVYRHQRAVDRIRSTITPATTAACQCVHIADVYVSFPNGSLKRPDISVFCREPDEDEEAITLVPEAVIEIISKGYEARDLQIGPPFYLSQGVKDIVVFNPYTLAVLHVHQGGAAQHISPVEISLACGCTVTV
jgi:Uma2 family endonuclease